MSPVYVYIEFEHSQGLIDYEHHKSEIIFFCQIVLFFIDELFAGS